MQITFYNGEVVQVGENSNVPQSLGSFSSNPIYIDTPSGTTPVQGTLTAGSSAAYPILGELNGFYLAFYLVAEPSIMTTKIKFAQASYVTTALAAIATALAADEAELNISVFGVGL